MQAIKMVILFVAIIMFSCAIPRTGNSRKPSFQPYIISADEIRSSTASQAYDLVRVLRPQWLTGRGSKSFQARGSISYPVVYVNESRHGDINSLSTISTDLIKEIKFLNAGDATIRFGLDHPSGAILISF